MPCIFIQLVICKCIEYDNMFVVCHYYCFDIYEAFLCNIIKQDELLYEEIRVLIRLSVVNSTRSSSGICGVQLQ